MPTKQARTKLAAVPKKRNVKLVKRSDWKKIPRYMRSVVDAERSMRP